MKRFAALAAALVILISCVSAGVPSRAFGQEAQKTLPSVNHSIGVNASPVYNPSSYYASSVYYSNLKEVVLSGNHRLDIVNVALSQVGYHEGNQVADLTGGSYGSGNVTEYGYWYGMCVLGNGTGFFHEWCAMFTAWSARQARVPVTVVNNAAYAHIGMNPYYFNVVFHNRGTYTPRTGDLIIYDWANNGRQWDHVGIVLYVENGRVHTVEGNSSDRVIMRDFSLNDHEIQGFGAPFYTGAANVLEPSSYPVPSRNLSLGASGDDVKWMQAALLHAGFPTPVDGYFGFNTQRQLKKFQVYYGLSSDGVLGPVGRQTLKAVIAAPRPGTEDPANYPVPSRTLTLGCCGNDVKWLQAALKRLGFTASIDGEFGPRTKSALIALQTSYGLVSDGVCDAITRDRIRGALDGASAGQTSGDYPVPTRVLKYGDSGNDVKWVQNALKNHGFDMNVTGYFGDKTKASLITFQQRNALTPDGICGPATVAKLKASPGQSTGGTAADPYAPSNFPVPTRVLRYGDNGLDVKWVQAVLRKNGFDMNVTGYFGDKTKASLITFQQRNGLAPDGMCGSATTAKLKASLTQQTTGGADPLAPSNFPVPTRVLRCGDNGLDVKWVQAVLRKNGFDMNVTGYFGDKTRSSLAAFQQRNGLTPDGICGPATIAKLKASVGGQSSENGIAYPVPTRVLRMGCVGDDVKWLQTALSRLGYSAAADGNFGPGTKNALIAFQRQKGLAADGECGSQTVAALKRLMGIS